jgi:hypothetical protein
MKKLVQCYVSYDTDVSTQRIFQKYLFCYVSRRGRDISLHHPVHAGSVGPLASYATGIEGSFPGVKAAGA